MNYLLRVIKVASGRLVRQFGDKLTDGTDYFAADVLTEPGGKIYRIIWLFEGESLEILGVINAYRRSKKKEDVDEKKKKK